jgi:nucleotide-binding universal stress UspA family protein
VDPSETARRAADEAAALAERFGAALHIVTAVGRGGYKLESGSETDHQITALDRAESLLADLRSAYQARVPEVTTAAVDGKPADVIVSEAERVDSDIIVVGNRRMYGAARILGAIANDVAHHARANVYIVNTVG